MARIIGRGVAPGSCPVAIQGRDIACEILLNGALISRQVHVPDSS